ncbi:MAG: VOC family protein [Pseudomonadota bacterium]
MYSVPMLFVKDVQGTAQWYQSLLGAQPTHGGDEFEMLQADGRTLLQLHLIEDGHHNHQVDLTPPFGNGCVLVVYVDSAADCYAQAQSMGATIRSELFFNEPIHMHEFTLADPNGYAVMVCEANWAQG